MKYNELYGNFLCLLMFVYAEHDEEYLSQMQNVYLTDRRTVHVYKVLWTLVL